MIQYGCTNCGAVISAVYKDKTWQPAEHRCNADGIIKRIQNENSYHISYLAERSPD